MVVTIIKLLLSWYVHGFYIDRLDYIRLPACRLMGLMGEWIVFFSAYFLCIKINDDKCEIGG